MSGRDSASFTATGVPEAQGWLVAENAKNADVSYEVRHLANAHGVRLAVLRGTGPNGQATTSDVRMAVASRAAKERRAQAAAKPDPTPTPTRPLPTFTASGINPTELLAVPAPVRMAMAGAETRAAAYNIKNRYAGIDDAEAAQQLKIDKDIPPEYGGWSWTWG